VLTSEEASVRWIRVMAVGAVACVVGCAGCGSQGPAPASTGSVSTGAASTGPLAAPWPEREILPENNTTLSSTQVLDLAASVLYALVPTPQESESTWLDLEAIDLRTGKLRRGETFAANGLALASGFLWVYGPSGAHGHPVLDEVDPRTLGTIRSVSMPGVSGEDAAVAVATGPAGSVWAATGGTLLRVSVSTGAVLARAVVPAGLSLTSLALDPGGMNLYAGAERLKSLGGVVLKYSAVTGALLIHADGGPLTGAISGAWVSAVPGGVWVALRTGMMGEGGLLSARSLAVVSGFPAINPATRGIGTVYGWTMSASPAYAGGALWVATDGGLVACVNPATGRVRAEEALPAQQDPVFSALAADGTTRQVDAVVSTSTGFTGVVAISPPRTCWR
jgi:hypothetical protein